MHVNTCILTRLFYILRNGIYDQNFYRDDNNINAPKSKFKKYKEYNTKGDKWYAMNCMMNECINSAGTIPNGVVASTNRNGSYQVFVVYSKDNKISGVKISLPPG